MERFDATKFCEPNYCSLQNCSSAILQDFVVGVGSSERENARLLQRMCATCISAGSDDGIEFHFFHIAARDALQLMGMGDWITFIFAVGLVTLQVSSDHRDVLLCREIGEQLGQMQSLRAWKAALAFIGDVRYSSTLLLVCTVSGLVLYRGTDGLNICLNALAALFVLEADSAIYLNGFDEHFRADFEDTLKTIKLSPKQESRLEMFKLVQLIILPVLFIGIVVLFGSVSNQLINHTALIVALSFIPPLLELGLGVHGRDRPMEKLLYWTSRRLLGVVVVSVISSVVPDGDCFQYDVDNKYPNLAKLVSYTGTLKDVGI